MYFKKKYNNTGLNQNDTKTTRGRSPIIAKEGGIPIVLNIMKMHSSNFNLMDHCKDLLTILNTNQY